jgi:putative oxidoreductase
MRFQKLLITDDSKSVIIIRLMVGSIFLSEGIQKFIFPASRSAGRFEKIGLPSPDFLAFLTGSFEISCAVLLLAGLITRLAVIPLLIIILSALIVTKIEIFNNEGLWNFLHESRTDWSMLLGLIFLIIKGVGQWSIDEKIQ